MKKSAFSHYNLDQTKRKTLKVTNFAGVDFSTQKFLVANNHAIDIMNYVYKNGVVQKRNGFTKISQLEATRFWKIDYFIDDQTGDNAPIETLNDDMNYYGIWNFKAEDGKNHVIAHIGKLLYEIKNISDEDNVELTPISSCNATLGLDSLNLPTEANTKNYCYEMPQEKINAFVGGHKLWILTGSKYMVLRYVVNDDSKTIVKLYPVEDSDLALVPTTTGGITYENSIASGRYSLDKVNLLTKYRKNLLLSGTTKNETDLNSSEYYDYTLDSPMVYKEEKDLANVRIVIKEKGVV